MNNTKDMNLQPRKSIVAIPLTTRGIGLLTNQSYKKLSEVCPNAVVNFTIHQSYRIALAQHQYQMCESESKTLPEYIPNTYRCENLHLNYFNDFGIQERVKGIKQAFIPIAELINSSGPFTLWSTSYQPIIYDPSSLSDEVSSSSSSDDESCKPSKQKRKFIPDPYVITFNNLRDTVVAMSDKNTDLKIRQDFIASNPIPGAKFINNILINPDDIIPPDYDKNKFIYDGECFQLMLDKLKKSCYLLKLIGECTFNGIGTCAQLVTVYKHKISLKPDLHDPDNGHLFRSIRYIESPFLLRGALSLLGEYPIHNRIDEKLFGIRQPLGHEFRSYLDWSHELVPRNLLSCGTKHIGQEQVPIIPITTRGIGLLSDICFKSVKVCYPKSVERSNCTVYECYRVALAQHNLQMSKSFGISFGFTDPCIRDVSIQNNYNNIGIVTEFENLSFLPVADLINSSGYFDFKGIKFRPIIYEPQKNNKNNIIPDPYVITINNLRDTVVALSDPTTDLDVRKEFIANNPIPGAKFIDNLLINPDEIIPDNYDRNLFAEDYTKFKSMLSILKYKMEKYRRKPYPIATCNFNGAGNFVQLVTAYKHHYSLSDPSIVESSCEYTCIRLVNTGYLVRGAICLLGEYPLHDRINRLLFGIRETPGHETSNQITSRITLAHDVLWEGYESIQSRIHS